MTVRITRELILQIRDDVELTDMARVIEGAHREASWQGFGSDWDMARFSAYMLREAGFGRLAQEAAPEAEAVEIPEDEQHTAWCRGGHEGPCRRGRLTGTEK
ncbi:hypothetical protein [Paenarthrobacter sp. YJN-5]|uniref:hypothetical protein n=1 Tax=Paenarthrobacter sp. YJN-5 TaxID=2735316 RepID=UPI001877F9D6|nr:hypothetical protein [Paenarthrobacter sp. YJN-5]QOT19207.1 hypothetical protein HMI59_23450 [Paenarthrobacter sp. YJN-5]